MLVKPDKAGDPYEQFLTGLPDLVPPESRYDATQGRPNPVTMEAIVVRRQRWLEKQKRWSERRYLQPALEAQEIHQLMDRSRSKDAFLETQSRPLGTGMSFEDWCRVRSQSEQRGFVPTRIGKDGRIPPSKPLTPEELEAWNAANDRLYQEWKKKHNP